MRYLVLFILFISISVSNTFAQEDDDGEEKKSIPTSTKQRMKYFEKEKREKEKADKKADKEAQKAHLKIQTKETRKRMKQHARQNRKGNEGKRNIFLRRERNRNK